MKQNYTHITLLLDRSTSMYNTSSDTIGAFNQFLQEQKDQPGEATLTLVQFGTDYEFTHKNVDIKSVPPLNSDTYRIFGCTALYDAMAMAIEETGKFLAELKEEDRPSKVIFTSLTDGEENSSKKHTADSLKALIQHQENVYKWAFLFLAAGQDAIMSARNIGISANNSLSYGQTSKGIKMSMSTMSKKMSDYRAAKDYKSAGAAVCFSAVDREQNAPENNQ